MIFVGVIIYISYAHPYFTWTSPNSGIANQGMVLLQMGDNNAANYGNGGQGAQPPPPPSLAQAVFGPYS